MNISFRDSVIGSTPDSGSGNPGSSPGLGTFEKIKQLYKSGFSGVQIAEKLDLTKAGEEKLDNLGSNPGMV